MFDRKFKVGLVQLDTGTEPGSSLEMTEQFMREAKDQGAELIILPEHADAIGKKEGAYAFQVPGKTTEQYSALARKYGVYLHCGSLTELNQEGKPYNTAVVFSPEGELLGTYRKMHLFDANLPDGTRCRETAQVSAGEDAVILDTDLCTLGLSICYDLRFPELYRLLALGGAELLVVSANFTAATGKDHWEPLLRARAIENGCYVAAVDQCGQKPFFKAWGHTMLIDPWGTVMGELDGEHPGLLMGELDPEKFREVRGRLPFRENRRPDVYTLKLC